MDGMNKNFWTKFFGWFTRLMPVWVVLAGVIGFFNPEIYYPLKPYTNWAFSLTMLGIGAVLNFEEFLPVFKKPHLVLLGTLTQFGVMPLGGFLIGKIMNLPAPLLVGLVMTGAVPGAMASNVISYVAKADVAYSISLTTTSTLLSPVLTPLFVYIFVHRIVKVPFLSMVLSILQMVIIPLFLGAILKHFFKKSVEKIKEFFPAFSTLFIAYICGLIVALNQKYILSVSIILFSAIFILNLAGLFSGYSLGGIYGFDEKRRRTLAIEVGMQNAGMGAVLSLKFFSSQTALVSALFATWCVITASFLAEIWKLKTRS
ncbi:MAG: bile acid:sodium symporter family protein [Elusimicrobia bacterium]|nr:bile acid:sodium symporter family protein [Elusimicrobiota bacterium]